MKKTDVLFKRNYNINCLFIYFCLLACILLQMFGELIVLINF